MCQLEPNYEEASHGRKGKFEDQKSMLLVGFNQSFGIRRLLVDTKGKRIQLIDEEGFLEDKQFMDIKQIAYNKIVAVTYDVFYYVIQYEGQNSDYSILVNKEPYSGQTQNWASSICLVPGFNLDYFPYAISKEYRSICLLDLREKTKQRIVRLYSQPTNSKFSTRLLMLEDEGSDTCSLYTDVRHIGLVRITFSADFLHSLQEAYEHSEEYSEEREGSNRQISNY